MKQPNVISNQILFLKLLKISSLQINAITSDKRIPSLQKYLEFLANKKSKNSDHSWLILGMSSSSSPKRRIKRLARLLQIGSIQSLARNHHMLPHKSCSHTRERLKITRGIIIVGYSSLSELKHASFSVIYEVENAHTHVEGLSVAALARLCRGRVSRAL